MKCSTTGAPSASGSPARARGFLARGRNIYLAGFMGTGKSAAARILARRLGYRWADLDSLVEEEEGASVSEIFRQRGERSFRLAERRVLRRLAREGGRVVALGGGVVCFAENRDVLRGTGPVVVLTATPETIWKRIGGSGTRPLLAGDGGFAGMCALLRRRGRDYRRYRRRVDTEHLTPDGVADAVADLLQVPEAVTPQPRRRPAVARRTCR